MTTRCSAMMAFLVLLVPAPLLAQHPAMPPGVSHEQHLAQLQREQELKKRGIAAMGFDQDAVAHHFLLKPTGGAIEVDVRDPVDTKTLDAIRTHLREIAKQFAEGDFRAPFATHAEVPPGVPALQRLKSTITCSYGQTASGARVEIVTENSDALAAVHEFLRYQIAEHHTGDGR